MLEPEVSASGRRLIVFARFPEAGRVKTRLIPALGERGAAELHQRMLARTLDWARQLAEQTRLTLELRFDRNPSDVDCTEYGIERRRFQGPGGLGDRLTRAVDEVFADTANPVRRVVIIGTDCPELSAEVVTRAFADLERRDVVLGPAADGGYYLIGLREPAPELFSGIDWGSDRVCAQTVRRARATGLTVAFLEVLDDVDVPGDLVVWERATGEKVATDG